MFARLGDSTRTPHSVGKLVSQSRTPSQWLLVETKSKMMAPSPLQRVRVRTPSRLAITPSRLTPSVQKFRVGSSSCLTPMQLRAFGATTPCKTPLPVYQRFCSDYFRGKCTIKNCLESHDPGLVSRCVQFASEGKCDQGNDCDLRHDRPNQLDKRPLFDIEKYKELQNQKANELRIKIQEEDQKYRDEKRPIYTRDAYKHDLLDETHKTICFGEAMKHLKTIQDEYFTKVKKVVPTVEAPAIHIHGTESDDEDDGIYSDEDSFDVDTDVYICQLVSWLSTCNIISWTAKQVYQFYDEATSKAVSQIQHDTEIINKLFTIYQPGFETWAEVFNMINLEMTDLVDTMHEWMKYPGITELHVGGLYAGLLRIKSKKWNLDQMAKLLMNTIASSLVSVGIVCVSNRIPDGYFILGICKYLDIDVSSKLIKFYLKSKEEKDESECGCDSFVCLCPAMIEWDLYGIPLFRPIFDYLDWELLKKAELFAKSTEGLWVELEIKAVLGHILNVDAEKEFVFSKCKPRETTSHILKHLYHSGAFEDMPRLNECLAKQMEELIKDEWTKHENKEKPLVQCLGIEKDIDGSTPKQCGAHSKLHCKEQLCDKCCQDKGGFCEAHHPHGSISHDENLSDENMNAFFQLICTDDDEEWDYVTFHGIKPTMTYESVQQFEESIAHLSDDDEKLKKVDFTCAADVTDDVVKKLAKAFGEALEVIELQTANPGDFCKIEDVSVDVLVRSCPHLVKLRLVGCTEISSDAFLRILTGCKKLQSLEVSGVAKFSGFLKDKCLEPLFTNALPDLRFLNLLDQFFLHTATVDRLRRNRKNLKIIVGERDSGDAEDDVIELMAQNGALNLYTNEDNFTDV